MQCMSEEAAKARCTQAAVLLEDTDGFCLRATQDGVHYSASSASASASDSASVLSSTLTLAASGRAEVYVLMRSKRFE